MQRKRKEKGKHNEIPICGTKKTRLQLKAEGVTVSKFVQLALLHNPINRERGVGARKATLFRKAPQVEKIVLVLKEPSYRVRMQASLC